MKKKWFASEMAFKIYSLLLAIFLWVFAIYDLDPESTKVIRNIPVRYSNLDALERAGYTIYEEDDLFTDFVVKGKRIALGKLSKQNVRASITFSEFREGTYDISVDAILPQNDMSVSKKSPATISVKIEQLLQKPLKVGIIYSGTNSSGKLASAELATEEITVKGPATAVNRVKSAKISLDYSTVASTESGTSNVRLYDYDGNDITNDRNLSISTDKISWTQKLYNVKDVAVDIVFSNSSYTMDDLKLSENAVKLCCDSEQSLDFESVNTLPVSSEDAKKLKNGESIEVTLDLPDHVSVIRQNSDGRWVIDDSGVVKIAGKVMHVEKIPVNTGRNLEITDTNDNKNYSLKNVPDYIFIKCVDSDRSDELWEAVFKVSAKNLENGEHKVKITAELPDNTSIMESYEVTLVVSDKE